MTIDPKEETKRKPCPDCKGSGRYVGLGFWDEDCRTCEGKGYLEPEEPTPWRDRGIKLTGDPYTVAEIQRGIERSIRIPYTDINPIPHTTKDPSK